MCNNRLDVVEWSQTRDGACLGRGFLAAFRWPLFLFVLSCFIKWFWSCLSVLTVVTRPWMQLVMNTFSALRKWGAADRVTGCCWVEVWQSCSSSYFLVPLQAYNLCNTDQERVCLLSDLLIRRGEGVTSTSRRVGPELSKRLFLIMNSSDPEQTLDSSSWPLLVSLPTVTVSLSG